MFQYQGSSSSSPVRSPRAKIGARNPVLRAGLIGKLNAGTARIGTPLKRKRILRA